MRHIVTEQLHDDRYLTNKTNRLGIILCSLITESKRFRNTQVRGRLKETLRSLTDDGTYIIQGTE